MITDGTIIGRPLVAYTDTHASILAIESPAPGMFAYASDTHLLGTYNGTSWDWGGGVVPGGANTNIQYNNNGTFGGDANLSWNASLQRIEIGGPRPTASTTTSGINLLGDDDRALSAQVVQWYFGASSNPSYVGRRARGSISSPSVPQSGDTLVSLSGGGFVGPGATTFSGTAARVSLDANETWAPGTPNSLGTRVGIWTVASGSATLAEVARFDNASGVTNLATNLYTTKDYVLTIERTGAVIVRTATPNIVADTVGNSRGTNAVDLQLAHSGTDHSQVASGYAATIPGGYYNKASGDYSFATGRQNTASGNSSICLGGGFSTASGAGSASMGQSCVATSDHAFCFGYRAITSGSAGAGSFVWGDGTEADFSAITTNEFAIRATNGLRVAYDDGSYFTAKVANTTGVATFNAVADAGAGSFVFTPAVTFTAAPILSTMTAGWLPYMGASKEIVGSANATLDASGNAYFAGRIRTALGVYSLNIENKYSWGAEASIWHNAYTDYNVSSGTKTYRWANTHANFGSRGIEFDFATGGINFFADNAATIAGNSFTPTLRMSLSNAGALTISGAFGCNGATAQAAKAHIVNADGTIADITSKFNTLLANLESFGFLATS